LRVIVSRRVTEPGWRRRSQRAPRHVSLDLIEELADLIAGKANVRDAPQRCHWSARLAMPPGGMYVSWSS